MKPMNLVIGADGLIGAGLLRALQAEGMPALGTSRRAGSAHLPFDLREPERFRPPAGGGVAFLCTGGGGVAECAERPEETRALLVDGVARLARWVHGWGFRPVLISSSLVFDGTRESAGPEGPLSPTSTYGRWKALAESAMPEGSAIVRVGKLVESLRPRLQAWHDTLRQGGIVRASSRLPLAPVALRDLVDVLVTLARDFQPGVHQLSARDSLTYVDAAHLLADALGAPQAAVVDDGTDPRSWFERLGPHATLAVRVPGGGWTPPASRAMLRAAIERLLADQAFAGSVPSAQATPP